MNDPIIDEVRRIRDAHAARFNYDLDEIYRDIKEKEKKSGRKFVSFPPRKVETNQAPPPTATSIGTSGGSTPSQTAPTTDR